MNQDRGPQLSTVELWSRQSWPNLDVAGESYHADDIRRLFPSRITDRDRELVTTATLQPEPGNRHDPFAVKVVVDGQHIGYLPKDVAKAYASRLQALAPTVAATPCRIYGYEYEAVDYDRRGREVRYNRFEASARICLDEPHLILPLNAAPGVPYRLLPPGAALQLKEEEQHLEVLAPLVHEFGAAWVQVSLHRREGEGSRRDVIEARVDGRPIGVLTPAMSANFFAVVDHLRAQGVLTTARVLLTGNALRVEAVLYAAKAHELDATWAASAVAPLAPVLTDRPQVRGAARPSSPVVVPPRPTRILFNPPPGWPAPPEGSEPPPGWSPPSSWPEPPADWEFWVAR